MAIVGQQYTIFKCQWCHKHLLTEGAKRKMRSDKKFCDATCRNAYNRWIRRQQKRYDHVFAAFAALEPYLEFQDTRDLAINMFATLRGNIDLRLKEHGVILKGDGR